MRIDRSRSHLTFRKRRRNRLLPLTLGFGLLVGVLMVSWYWIGERWLQRPPSEPSIDMQLQHAARAFSQGNLDSAIDYAQMAWGSSPTYSEALTLLARALIYRSYEDYNQGADRQTALALTTEAYQRMPTDTDIIAIHAFTLQANGHTADAERVLARALTQSPNHALSRVTQSLTYGANGVHEQARQEAINAINLSADMDGYRALAFSLSDLGKPNEAIRAIDQALAGNDKLLALLFEKAMFSIQAGFFDTATATYFRILAFDPSNIKARLRMCELSSILREAETALDYCQQVTNFAPTWADGWYRLGREYYLRGEFIESKDALHRCAMLQSLQNIAVSDRILDCWILQGEIAELLGDCEALLKAYNDYQNMTRVYQLHQTWVYPPEGPAICLDPIELEAG
jgi:tetratricopeptide (TPR) repeat protein